MRVISTEDDERTASAFRIDHRTGTAVLPPCSTPRQLTGTKTKNHPPGCGWVLLWTFHPNRTHFYSHIRQKKFIYIPVFLLVIGISAGVFLAEGF